MKIKKKNRITAAFLAVGLSVTTLSAQLPVSAAEDTEDGTEDLFSDTEQIDYDDADTTDSDTVYDETPVDDTGSDTDYEDQDNGTDTGADAQITDTSGTAEAVETQDTAVPDVAADAGSSAANAGNTTEAPAADSAAAITTNSISGCAAGFRYYFHCCHRDGDFHEHSSFFKECRPAALSCQRRKDHDLPHRPGEQQSR